MERGLYIAASGMLAEQVRQDQLANDLANASTPGYKADNSEQASFSDLLLWNSSTGAPVGSTAPASSRSPPAPASATRATAS
jgi:flagellar basal-body rod protein FlgG